jgi:SNF2 family DNA or RNA helicase
MLQPGAHQLQVVQKFDGLPAAICGDSMGVGKTLSAIMLDFSDRNKKRKGSKYRTLIICQKGGISVWKWHLIDQGVPEDRILAIDPEDREPMEQELQAGCNNYSYYIIHWDALIRLENIVRPKQKKSTQVGPVLNGKRSLPRAQPQITWDHIIADEIQFAKNRNTKRTRVLKELKTHKKTGLSGTPADDKPQDFWSILNWCYPQDHEFKSYWRFYDRYIQWHMHPQGGYRIIDGTKNMDQFHEKIAPFYIRRTLEDVVDDMPPKTRGQIWVDLTKKQRQDYDDMFKYQVARIGEMKEELVAGYKISMYMRLQQMMLATVTELDWTDYEKNLKKYGPDEQEWPKGTRKGPKIVLGEPSPKLDVVFEKVDEAIESGQGIVLFTHFQAMADLMEARCQKLKIPVSKVTGAALSQKVRDAAVADFQSGKAKVFVGTIGAAGTSITLTAARTLIFTDRHWNPSKNAQAEDRVWRIGQKYPVNIWDILARDTIDEERLKKIWLKAQSVHDIVTLPKHLNEAGAVLL